MTAPDNTTPPPGTGDGTTPPEEWAGPGQPGGTTPEQWAGPGSPPRATGAEPATEPGDAAIATAYDDGDSRVFREGDG